MKANKGGRSGEGSSRGRETGKRKRRKTVGESSQSESVSGSEEELPPGLSEAQKRKEKAKNDMEKWQQTVLAKSVTCERQIQQNSRKEKSLCWEKFKPEYKLMTKIIHYNIAPTRSEKELKLADVEFLYVMMNSVIIDVAESVGRTTYRRSIDPATDGPITMTSVKKSSAMSRPPKVPPSASVNVPPSSEIPPDIPSIFHSTSPKEEEISES
ncbi:hypothetical protein Acr_14g0006390 [Actinidia rufa]|uniref:Uncharacterized protein n=1 Tax=Actinidia rufa TaxID=165716 RepID=A0A7J0FQY6_9ERIC|nr:hypothetical protein Acr_14g0006390 [Actinidia rufa]